MANLNLSEFGEKTFVADADWTFVWDTAGAISKKVSRNNWLNSGELTTSAPVTISQTWNASAVAFTAFKVNATSTNSATGSLLLDLQVGGASKFTVNKGGGIISKANIITADGATGAAGLSLEMVFANYGIGIDSNGNTAFLVNGLAKSRAGFGVAIASDQSLSFTNTTHVGGNATADTILVRDAANTLALRNGAAAQTFRVYNTYSNAGADYERGEFVWSGSTFYVQTINLGTGQTRPISFGGQSMAFRTNSGSGLTERMAITAAGNVGIGTTAPSSKLHVASGAINIMQAGTNAGVPYISVGDTAIYGDALDSLELRRPSSAAQTIKLYGTYTASPLAYERLTISAPSSGNAIIGTNKSGTGAVARGLEFQTDGVTRLTIAAGGAMTAGGALTCSQVTVGAGAYLFHGGQVAIGSSGNGKHILFDAGGTFYDRLQIGGTSASFPAIKRVGTDLQIVLASTTAAAGVAAGDADLTFIEDRYRRKGAGSPEGVVTAPIGAVYHRTDGGLMSSFYVKESGTGNTGWVGK